MTAVATLTGASSSEAVDCAPLIGAKSIVTRVGSKRVS
jgi:hypothetical protein